MAQILAVAVLLVLPSIGAAAPVECPELGGEPGTVWPHPDRPGLVALLCHDDSWPGWFDSLWIVETADRSPASEIRVPLHGSGVAHFSWLDCSGPPLAYVVDRTHMGTITEQVLRLESGGRLRFVARGRLGRGADPRSDVRCLP